MMGILHAILRFFGFAHDPPKDMLLLVSPLRHSREQMTKASNDFMRTMQMQAYQAAEDQIDPEPSFIGRVNAEVGMVEQQMREHRK